MLDVAHLNSAALDVQTLSFVAVCIAALLGMFLSFAWLQHRDTPALAWWGSAYLIVASAIAMWVAPRPLLAVSVDLPPVAIFLACGMIWNGVRLFQGRRQLPVGMIAGAAIWLMAGGVLPDVAIVKVALATAIVGGYALVICYEFMRERRRSQFSRTAAIAVTGLHGGMILLPLFLLAVVPRDIAQNWHTVLALGAIVYAVAVAFLMLLAVKDHHVQIYRKAATVDNLTGLLNRGAFMTNAIALCARQAKKGKPVTVMMFDLDRFKSINDRFGHATGDDVLRLFARVVEKSTRADDLVGRLGGEEFAAIVPEPIAGALIIGERLRAAFEAAGVHVGAQEIGATVSIGAACSADAGIEFDALLVRADAALYEAKNGGRNRVCVATGEAAGPGRKPASQQRAEAGGLRPVALQTAALR
jgi:diguanylate cyclase (GGDEF)-like protein